MYSEAEYDQMIASSQAIALELRAARTVSEPAPIALKLSEGILFVKQRPDNYALCPCGSEIKYKWCCKENGIIRFDK